MDRKRVVKPINDISIIVAVGKNREIGKDNRLLWQISKDMAWFKKHTENKIIVMGRKTFESMGSKPLPKRTNIVLSRNANYEVPEGVLLMRSITEVLEEFVGVAEIMVIGGWKVYEEFLPITGRIYMTEVDKKYEADTFFPVIDWKNWDRVLYEAHQTEDGVKYSFNIYNRIS